MDKVDVSVINKIKEKGLCQDDFIGTIKKTRNDKSHENLHFTKEKRISFKKIKDIKPCDMKDSKNIVIVLESPHKEEFMDATVIIAPALGRTGYNLQKNFEKIFTEGLEINPDEEYSVILMNAIQYQCSNAESLKEYRDRTDRIWEYFWSKEGEDSFLRRIKSYKALIIINACTGDFKRSGSIKHILQDCISKNCIDSILYSSPHPSSAWFKHGYVKKCKYWV